MNYVEPIRDRQKLIDVQEYLKRQNPRDYIMFIIGVYTGLRISDILNLKVRDTKSVKYIILREQKTGKERLIEKSSFIKKELAWYTDGKPDDEYLVKSREQENKPLTRFMAYKILNEVGKSFGLQRIGTHTLRKTFGYHYYKQTKDVALLQKMFNHSDPSITLRYIGILQDDINNAIKNFTI
jgi:integrase